MVVRVCESERGKAMEGEGKRWRGMEDGGRWKREGDGELE